MTTEQDRLKLGKPGEEVRASPRPRAVNGAVEPPSSAWALEARNKHLIDDLSDPEQTTLNFSRAGMDSLHKGPQFPA